MLKSEVKALKECSKRARERQDPASSESSLAFRRSESFGDHIGVVWSVAGRTITMRIGDERCLLLGLRRHRISQR